MRWEKVASDLWLGGIFPLKLGVHMNIVKNFVYLKNDMVLVFIDDGMIYC